MRYVSSRPPLSTGLTACPTSGSTPSGLLRGPVLPGDGWPGLRLLRPGRSWRLPRLWTAGKLGGPLSPLQKQMSGWLWSFQEVSPHRTPHSYQGPRRFGSGGKVAPLHVPIPESQSCSGVWMIVCKIVQTLPRMRRIHKGALSLREDNFSIVGSR